MRFAIQRETLLKLLRVVSGVVDRRHQQNPILSNVLLRATENTLSIIATDQEVELIGEEVLTTIQDPGAITVPFRKLSEISKALPDGAELVFELQAERALIKSGRSRFTLATLPAEQFPDVQKFQADNSMCSISLPKKQFRWLVARTAFAMADQDVRYFLNGMLLEVKHDKLFSVAADGHRLAMNYIALAEHGLPPVRVIVPRKGILEIMRMADEDDADLRLTILGSHIRAQSGGVTITSKLLDGKFPDYERVIPRDGSMVVIGDREKLKEAFHRASALFSEKFRGVRLRMSNARLMVLASNPEQDEVEEDLEVEYQGQDLEVGFNVRYLIDFLSVVQSELVRFTFSDSNKSTLIEEVGGDVGGGAYVLMPIRT
jgi:DNA polymerase-3 subunit beta